MTIFRDLAAALPSGPCIECSEPTVLYIVSAWDEWGQPAAHEWRCVKHCGTDLEPEPEVPPSIRYISDTLQTKVYVRCDDGEWSYQLSPPSTLGWRVILPEPR